MIVARLLDQLAETHPEWCKVVELKYFLGMTEEEAAEVLALKLRAMQLHAARTPANGSSSAWNPEMPPNPPDDDAVMTAMQAALARPAEERDSYLQSTCAHDLELYRQARNYVEWETRMQGFARSVLLCE